MGMVLVLTRIIVVLLAATIASPPVAEMQTTSANLGVPDVRVPSPATESADEGESDGGDGGPEPAEPTDDKDGPEVPDGTPVRAEPTSEPTTSPSDDPQDGAGTDAADDHEDEPTDSREVEDTDEDGDRDEDRSDWDDDPGDEGDDDEERSDPDDDRDNGSLVRSGQATVVADLLFAGPSASFGPDSISDKPSCAVNCIISGIAYATETEAWLEVKTTAPVRYYLEVTSSGYSQDQENDWTWETTFVVHFDGLQPGTVYNAWLLVRDEYGNKQEASGSFKTAG